MSTFLVYIHYGRYPKEKADVFPESLRKAHDLLTMQNNNWSSEYSEESKSLTEINKKWKHLAFKGKKYSVLLPKETKEVIIEGKKLNHCVGTYVRSIINGKCLILFLRENKNLSKPLFTMEYDLHGRIVQIKGSCNGTIDQISSRYENVKEEIIDFLLLWGEKNNIDVGIEKRIKEAA